LLGRRLSVQEFRKLISSIDGRGYGSYKRLLGKEVAFKEFSLKLTHIQGDPHAPPSHAEALIPKSSLAQLAQFMKDDSVTPLTDYLSRELHKTLKKLSRRCGEVNSCYLGVPKPSPRILRRSSVELGRNHLILRFFVGLPSQGRRASGREAVKLLTEVIPEAIGSLIKSSLKEIKRIEGHVRNFRLQEGIRSWLVRNRYFFFIGNGSILPRRASFSEEPLPNAVRFTSPETLKVEVCIDRTGCVKGLGVKDGVTAITGGAYHGKTTLLEAIIDGIYDHVLGDGREHVVSVSDTYLVRAEDGRVVTHVDISSLMRDLPDGTSTRDFSSLDASGSASMAASIMELVELEVKHLVLDEDISATNLLYKDDVMKDLLKDDPIITLDSVVKPMNRVLGVSTAAVVSASASFLKCSDTIILMRKYLPQHLNEGMGLGACKESGVKGPHERIYEGISNLKRVKALGMKIIAEYFDGVRFEVDLSRNPRIVEAGQAKLIAKAISELSGMKQSMRMAELIDKLRSELRSKGFRAFYRGFDVPPDLAWVDPLDIVWIINRLRNVKIKQTLNPSVSNQ